MTIFMNIALVWSVYKDLYEYPVCHTRNYLQDNSSLIGLIALPWSPGKPSQTNQL